MLFGGGVLVLFELGLLVYCVLDVVTTPEAQVRNMPKPVWLLLIVVVPLVGGIAWLVAGRPQGASTSMPYKGNRGLPPQPRRTPRAAPVRPDDDEEFLRGLRARAEEQRRTERQRRAEGSGEGA